MRGRRNPVARALSNPALRPRVVPSLKQIKARRPDKIILDEIAEDELDETESQEESKSCR